MAYNNQIVLSHPGKAHYETFNNSTHNATTYKISEIELLANGFLGGTIPLAMLTGIPLGRLIASSQRCWRQLKAHDLHGAAKTSKEVAGWLLVSAVSGYCTLYSFLAWNEDWLRYYKERGIYKP